MPASIESINPNTVWAVPDNFTTIYSHATAVEGAAKWMFVSGQFGVAPCGALRTSFREQAEQALDNIEALLSHAGMGMGNLVKLTYFLTNSEDAVALAEVRMRRWKERQPPAVTVLTVSALARPEYLIEIEAVAAIGGTDA
ncbi:RidA family protein [Hoeflea sp. CAU 1731]